jgi:hypothetical protein
MWYGGEARVGLPSLPSPSASPYHVAVAGCHSMPSPAALPAFFADFPPPNRNAAATGGGGAESRTTQRRTRVRAREEAMEGEEGDGSDGSLPSASLCALGLDHWQNAVAWSGELRFGGALFYGFEKSHAASLSELGGMELGLAGEVAALLWCSSVEQKQMGACVWCSSVAYPGFILRETQRAEGQVNSVLMG